VIATLLVFLFAITLRWLPPSGSRSLEYAVLPALAMAARRGRRPPRPARVDDAIVERLQLRARHVAVEPECHPEVERAENQAVEAAERGVDHCPGGRARRSREDHRELTLDDIDLHTRRIRLGGHTQPLSVFVHDVLAAWLRH
jgi:hypothetical protein